MGATYGSMEWLDLVQKALNDDETVRRDAANLDAAFQYIIQSDDLLDESIECGWTIRNGECVETWTGRNEADFVMVGPYSVFKDINKGRTAATTAMMNGDLQIQGVMTELVKHNAAITAMQEVLEGLESAGETEWPA